MRWQSKRPVKFAGMSRGARLETEVRPSEKMGQLCRVVHGHLFQDTGAVVIDCFDADSHVVGDFLRRVTNRKEFHNLMFPG